MNTELRDLRMTTRQLEDVEQTRVRGGNRLAASRRQGYDDPEFEEALDGIGFAEEKFVKLLVSKLKVEAPKPVLDFAKATSGIGLKSLARLMGEVGDFATFTEAWWEEGDEKTEGKKVLVTGETFSIGVRDLWSYCGVGDPTRKMKGGITQAELFALGNPRAKKQAWLMATACLKAKTSPYNPLYYTVRAKYEKAVHSRVCAQCGTKGHPAPEGSALRPGHVHANALRLVAKAILKDLWRVRHGQEPVYGAKTEWSPNAKQHAPRKTARAA